MNPAGQRTKNFGPIGKKVSGTLFGRAYGAGREGMPWDPDREVQTPEAFAAAYSEMSDADIVRLRRIATAIARRNALEADDVLQSAAVAVLSGKRHWPTGVALVAFMRGVMRSVADNEKRKVRPLGQRPIPLFDAHAGIADIADDQPGAERAVIASKLAAKVTEALFSRFEGDEAASLIFMGMLEGLEGEALREATGLEKTAYETKRRWVRRQINDYLAREGEDGR